MSWEQRLGRPVFLVRIVHVLRKDDCRGRQGWDPHIAQRDQHDHGCNGDHADGRTGDVVPSDRISSGSDRDVWRQAVVFWHWRVLNGVVNASVWKFVGCETSGGNQSSKLAGNLSPILRILAVQSHEHELLLVRASGTH